MACFYVQVFDSFIELSGDGRVGRDSCMIGGVASFATVARLMHMILNHLERLQVMGCRYLCSLLEDRAAPVW